MLLAYAQQLFYNRITWDNSVACTELGIAGTKAASSGESRCRSSSLPALMKGYNITTSHLVPASQKWSIIFNEQFNSLNAAFLFLLLNALPSDDDAFKHDCCLQLSRKPVAPTLHVSHYSPSCKSVTRWTGYSSPAAYFEEEDLWSAKDRQLWAIVRICSRTKA